MKRVLASGAFDILHPGHLHYLRQARALGDELYVIVASDETIAKRKREPVMKQEARLELVSALAMVDKAVAGLSQGDHYELAASLEPDIIAIGYDQKFENEEIKQAFQEKGLTVEVERVGPLEGGLNGSRKIIGRIKDRYREASR